MFIATSLNISKRTEMILKSFLNNLAQNQTHIPQKFISSHLIILLFYNVFHIIIKFE